MKNRYFGLTLLLIYALSGHANGQPAPSSLRLNHIALQVTNLEASTRFYQQVLGLDTIANPFNDGRHTWLQIPGSGHLHLIVSPTQEAPVMPLKQTHFCFSLPNVEFFASKLKQLNIPYEDWPGQPQTITLRADGVRQLYLQDPDGYWIEINDDYPRKRRRKR